MFVWYVRIPYMHSALFVRDAIFPHLIHVERSSYMLKDIAIASYVWKPERSCMIVRLTYEIRRKERLSGIHPTICIISLSYRRECTMNVSGGVWDLKLSPMDHHRLLGPGGGSPPTNRAKLDSTTSDTLGKLDDLDSWLRPWVKVPVAGDFQLKTALPSGKSRNKCLEARAWEGCIHT